VRVFIQSNDLNGQKGGDIMRGESANVSFQANAVLASYEQAVRTGNESRVKTLREVNPDCTYLFDEADKRVFAEV